jgi:hypothetical protein
MRVTKIQKQIIAMLTENTGKHIGDSGGDNNRAWQRNQNKNFLEEARVTIESDYQTVSTFHYLSEVLDTDQFSDKVNAFFKRKRKNSNIDAHWVQSCFELLMQKYEDAIISTGTVVNTYNHENNLSQILLFVTFNYEGNKYTLLQIHGGADVRGGYTDTRCFKLNGYLTGNVDIIGSVNGKDVDNMYNGYSLTYENGGAVDYNVETDKVLLDFYVMEHVD